MKIIGIESGTSYAKVVGQRQFTISGLAAGLNLYSVIGGVTLHKSGETTPYAIIYIGSEAWTWSYADGVYTVNYSAYASDMPVLGADDFLTIGYTDDSRVQAIEAKVDLVQTTVESQSELTRPDHTTPVYMPSQSGFFEIEQTGLLRSFAPASHIYVNDVEVQVGAAVTAGQRARLTCDVAYVGTTINVLTAYTSTVGSVITAQRSAAVVNISDNLTGFQHLPSLGAMKALKGALVGFDDSFFSGAIGGESITTAVDLQYFYEDSAYIYWVGNSYLFRKNKLSGEISKTSIGISGNCYVNGNDNYIITSTQIATNNRTGVFIKSTLAQLLLTPQSNTGVNGQTGILVGNKLFTTGNSQYLYYYLLPDATAYPIISSIVSQIYKASDGFIYAAINSSPNIQKINTVGTPSIQSTLALFAASATVRHMEEYNGQIYCVSTGGIIRSFNLSNFTYNRQIGTGLGILNIKIHNDYLYGVTTSGTIYCIDLSTDLVVKTTANTYTNGGFICDIDRVNEVLAISNYGDLGYKIYKLEDLRV